VKKIDLLLIPIAENKYIFELRQCIILLGSLCTFSILYANHLQTFQDKQSEKFSEKYCLVICAVFQNESFFLKQWIEFHKLMGVDHFYLYNNLSTDNYQEILQPYVDEGLVEVIEWPVETHNEKEYLSLLQLPAYNHALQIVKNTAHWAAFIDLDEFLCPIRHNNMIELLAHYQDCAGIAINWQTFGTSRIDRLESDQLIIEHFIWKAPSGWEINKYIKMLVQPIYVDCFFNNPHYCLFKEGYFAVNSDKIPIQDLCEMQPILIDTIRLHHYWFGDRNWFISNKLPRRKKWGVPITTHHLDAFIDSFNQEKDISMLKFVDSKRSNNYTNYQK